MATVKLDPAKGVQIPNLSTSERNAISSPETGALIWNTTTSAINQYNGSAWSAVDTSTDNTKLPLAGGTMTGRLGIGAAPAATVSLDVTAASASSNNVFIRARNTATNEDAGFIIDGNVSGAQKEYKIGVNTAVASADLTHSGPAGYRWLVGGSEKVRIQAGGGISFNGDTAAANALDDYEEGTWTPTIVNGGSIGTVTYAIYTKVGDFVSFYLYCDSMSITNNSSAFEIGGLPHQISNSPNMYGGGQVGYTHNYNWGQHGATLHVNPGGNKIYFHKNTGTTATVTQANVQGLSYILLSGTYKSS